MSLQSRLPKRKEASQQAEVLLRDGKNRPILVAVPSLSDNRHVYTVTIGRLPSGILTQCKCDNQACQGNSYHTICYHSQAAILLAAGQGKTFWCESKADADRLNRIHKGIIIPVSSLQGKGKAWLVYVKN